MKDATTTTASSRYYCPMCSNPYSDEYSTDAATFGVYGTPAAWDAIAAYCYKDPAAFGKFLKNHYTTRSGFISFTPNTLNAWERAYFMEDDYTDKCNEEHDNAVSAAIRYIIESADDTYYYLSGYEEGWREIAENAAPWEYAETDGNITITATTGYNDETYCPKYTITATNADGKTLYTYAEDDPYDEIKSAYAFFEEHDMKVKEATGLSWDKWIDDAHRVVA